MSLIDELKRRNVFKVGAAYLALAWVVVQATGAIVPALNLPASLVPTVVWIGVIGFPCVLIFAWVYELTPEGLKRESEIDRSQSITHVTGKRLDYLIIGMLAVAIGLFVIDRVFPRDAASYAGAGHARDAGSPVGTGDARDDAADSRGSGPPPREEASTSVPDKNSIAVLPFADMSQARDQEYFSDGIAEELLNLLAKVPQLQVAARTSSFSYKGKDTRIAQIGQELNVAHVLEGSVRKAGNTLRITAQLVRTVDGYHLWSETYDRPLDDIFAVQDEIAGAVVEQLKIKLLGAAPKVRRTDPGAFTLGLQATQKLRQNTYAGFEQAFTLYQQALAIDPSYVDAWFGLGAVYSNWGFIGLGPRSADENFRLTREALHKALAIDPGYAPAHSYLGWIAMRYDDDLAAAARHLEQALALAPGDPFAISMASYLYVALGRLGTAIDLAEWVTPHDPMNAITYDAAGDANHRAGRLDEAIAHYRATLSLGPDRIHAHYGLGVALLLKGDKEAALTAMQAEPDEGWRLTGLALVNHALGRRAESDAALAELIEKHQKSWSSSIAWVYAYRGEADAAFEWLDKAVANHDTGVMSFPTEPLLASLHDDPRWLPFLTRLGKAPEQLAAIPFEVKLPSSAAQ